MPTYHIGTPTDVKLTNDATPLCVYQRPTNAFNRNIIILVHGLGGKSFGPKSTWGDMPSLLTSDLPKWDIGLYSYRTLTGRVRFWKSYPLTDEAEMLADELHDLAYDHIVLIGHSLGGVLIRLAAHSLNIKRSDSTLSRIVSMFLMASPTLGSHAAPKLIAPIARWLSHDYWALHTHNQAVSQIESLFSIGALSPEFNESLTTKNHIPLWTMIAAEDSWVSKLSASATAPLKQRRIFRMSHTEIVKPKSKAEEPYRWLLTHLEQIHDFCEPRVRLRRPVKGFEIRPASTHDLVEVCILGARELGSQMKAEDLSPFLDADPYCLWVIRDLKSKQLAGYWSVIALKNEATSRFTNQNARPTSLTVNSIAGPRDDLSALYVGAVIGTSHFAKGLALIGLEKSIIDASRGKEVRIIARAATADGLNLIHSKLLTPIGSDDIDQLFVGIAGGRRRNRKLPGAIENLWPRTSSETPNEAEQ